MRIESIKLLGGVLALRRFTIDELSAYTSVKRSTVSSWVLRNPCFVRTDEALQKGGRGRPPKLYEVRQEALPRMNAILADMPPATVEAANRPGEAGRPVSLDALTHARAYRDLLEETVPEAVREEARPWFAEWVRAAREQAVDFRRADVGITPEDEALLVEYERLLRPRPDAYAILKWADRYLAEVEANQRKSTGSSHAGRAGCGPVEDSDPLGMLAAVALSEKLWLPREVRQSIYADAGSIEVGILKSRIVEVFEAEERVRPSDEAMMVLLYGARQEGRLLLDSSVAGRLGELVARQAPSVAVRAAYAMLCAETASSRIDRVVRFISPLPASDDGSLAARMVSKATARADQAVTAILREVMTFTGRMLALERTSADVADEQNDFSRSFKSVFVDTAARELS